MTRQIHFHHLNNTRDLGGLNGADGRKTVSGKLLRSGHLFYADGHDLEKLSGLVDTIIDLRTLKEQEEKPDPEIAGVRAYHLPIMEDLKAGITREEKSDASAIEMLMPYPDKAKEYMCGTYEAFCRSARARTHYAGFVRLLLEEHEKAVLWHCTAGKDRAGFASVIVEELLGVSREDIFEDYLQTNRCLEEEIGMLIDMVSEMNGVRTAASEKALRYLFSAEPDYLETTYRSIRETYGSFEGYLSEGLGLTEAERAAFREKYLS